MVAQAEIERVGNEIGEAARAERVILFGSHATGQMSGDSDVDFLVVADSDLPRYKRSRDLYRKFRRLGFPLDVIVYTPEEVRRARQTPISFISQVMREGKTVYVR